MQARKLFPSEVLDNFEIPLRRKIKYYVMSIKNFVGYIPWKRMNAKWGYLVYPSKCSFP
jgi:hypothetical protein